jgi:hypothetical protein
MNRKADGDVFGPYPISGGINSSGGASTPRSPPSSQGRNNRSFASNSSPYRFNSPSRHDNEQRSFEFGSETPPQLAAMSRRISEPGALQGILHGMDISMRARRGDGIGSSWNPRSRQAVPEANQVFPQRILAGAWELINLS